MNEVELLVLGDALARASDVLRPDECIPFQPYLERVLSNEAQIAAIFKSDESFLVSVNGRPVGGPEWTLPVTVDSRVVLTRRLGSALDVLTRGVVRRICLN